MSRMLKALRQLESTQRLVAPAKVASPTFDDATDEPVVAVVESAVVKSPPPIVPVATTLSSEESFEPAFTSWKELSEPYDAGQSLSFGDFLGDSDAKVQTRESPDAVAPPVASAAVATVAVDPLPPAEPLADIPATIDVPEEQMVNDTLSAEQPQPLNAPVDEVEHTDTLEERVSDALDFTEELTAAIAEDVVAVEIAAEDVVETAAPEETSAEEPIDLVVAEPRALEQVDIEPPAIEEAIESHDVVVQPVVEVREIETETEPATDEVQDASDVLDEVVVAHPVEAESLLASSEPPELCESNIENVAEESEELSRFDIDDAAEDKLSDEFDPATADELPTEAVLENAPNVDEIGDTAIETSDEAVDSLVAEPDALLPALEEHPPADTDAESSASETDPLLVNNELHWGDLFPGSEPGGEPLDDQPIASGDQEMDDLVDSLGHFDVEELIANAPATAPKFDEPNSAGDDTLVETPPTSSEPQQQVEESTEYVTPAANPVDRAELSSAEAAALADLSNDPSLKQYNELADHIRHDLAKGEYRCAALVGAEHQPHVTETILRTAIAIGLGQTQHVLIVDASLNDKHLTAGLNLTTEFGLTEVIKGRVPWQQAVRATATPGVCVLPAGRLPPPKLDANDDRLKVLLKELTSQWDLVLLDAGNCQEPAATHVMAAARNVYLLVRLGETEADAAATAIAAIGKSGAKNRGCIATNA